MVPLLIPVRKPPDSILILDRGRTPVHRVPFAKALAMVERGEAVFGFGSGGRYEYAQWTSPTNPKKDKEPKSTLKGGTSYITDQPTNTNIKNVFEFTNAHLSFAVRPDFDLRTQ